MKMARSARQKSITNIYHVMLRGINRQQIFLDDEDNRMFLMTLEKCREISVFHLYAYVLMGNHVHILLQTVEEPLEQVMKRVGTRYALWYNNKYCRTGHLFQDRYRSEPVQDQDYFLTVLRYILYNPVKAGICRLAEDYPFSSAKDYFSGGEISETAFAEGIAGRDALLEYLKEPSDEECMDDTRARVNDKEALEIIRKITGGEETSAGLRMVADYPGQYVWPLRKAGLSIRQISRLTGLSIGIVRNK